MMNEGVSKLAHPLFFTLQRSDTLLGTVTHIGATITAATTTSVQVIVAVGVICRFNYM